MTTEASQAVDEVAAARYVAVNIEGSQSPELQTTGAYVPKAFSLKSGVFLVRVDPESCEAISGELLAIGVQGGPEVAPDISGCLRVDSPISACWSKDSGPYVLRFTGRLQNPESLPCVGAVVMTVGEPALWAPFQDVAAFDKVNKVSWQYVIPPTG